MAEAGAGILDGPVSVWHFREAWASGSSYALCNHLSVLMENQVKQSKLIRHLYKEVVDRGHLFLRGTEVMQEIWDVDEEVEVEEELEVEQ